ncbi:signal peptidase I [Dehalococcoidales bacterium]|nr:signal peptidase I [Dehalococcoidales bacterium]
MKRALALILIIAACIAGFLSIRGELPFMPVFGTSMEPELKDGSLILIKEIQPTEVKEGDIIVFSIPPMVREAYNYPPVIAHRVVRVITEPALAFRTKGDNTGEDPFTVRPQDIKGTVSQQIPYLGFPLLFFQSREGLIFIIIALFLLGLYLYGDELSRGKEKMHKGIFAPVIAESRRTSRVMERRMEDIEKGMATTQQALEKFASAIEVYAEHLKSHTSAVQGLSEASQELKSGAAEQNKVLIRLMEAMEQTQPKVEEVAPKVEKVKFPPGCIRNRQPIKQPPSKEDEIFWAE